MTTASPDLVDPADAGSVPRRAGTATRRADRIARSRRVGLRVLAVVALVGIWWAITAVGIWPELIVPRPSSVWQRFVESVTTHDGVRGLEGHYLWEHLWASGKRLVVGVTLAIVVGVPIGLAMATVRPLRTVTEPFMNFVRSLPPLAYFSLLIIWFGIDDTSKYWLLFLAALAPVALSVVAGAESIRPEWFDAARSQGASRFQVVRHLVVPAVRPEMFTGIRLAIGFAFTTIVAAETVNGIPGIGGLAWSTKKFNQTDIAILCVIVIGLCAVAIDQVIRSIERRAVPWKGKA